MPTGRVTELLPVEQLNSSSRERFAAALKPLFEAAAPLVDALYTARPFTSYSQLIDIAESLSTAMPLAQQIEVLSAHPRIGAAQHTLSEASRREQSYGTQPADAVLIELAELNQQYEECFGFCFVVFVNKRPRSEIVDVLRERLRNPADEERRTGLAAMFAIARDRLANRA